ncbi:hypothetical protein AGDE_05961 [Angomonas deanei]|nr:hypothetical protein AGDE_05961 [Angomonas deanei]|eukprot:EPY37972.1 hypothetical protein AGDE_05961 [Angomonas deanei]
MFVSSDDDDLPPIPTTTEAPPSMASKESDRLRMLEDRVIGSEVDPTAVATRGTAVEPVSMSDVENDNIQLHLRQLVPFLSAEFSCSFSDAALIIGAIERGGSRGGLSLEEKLNQLDAEKKNLESRIKRKDSLCDELKDSVAESRHKVEAIRKESNQSKQLFSQRVEEMRKRLLMEEGRTEKLQMQVKRLEMENNELRDKIRGRRL